MSALTLPNTHHQVSCEWLSAHLTDEHLVLLDASMENPVNNVASPANVFIKGARRFDFSQDIVDGDSDLPNTMPSSEVFQQKVRLLGVNRTSTVVVYDKQGLFSAARAWLMFKAMGFDRVAILQGGLPAWLAAGFATQTECQKPLARGDFSVTNPRELFVGKQYVLDAIVDSEKQIVDARSYGRFSGQQLEPRKGMRSGHIPHSLNLHYAALIENGCLLDKAQLSDIFTELVPSPNEFIFSCGSGVTACILALAADIAGFDQYKVYDGSWSEWGKDKLLPIDSKLN